VIGRVKDYCGWFKHTDNVLIMWKMKVSSTMEFRKSTVDGENTVVERTGKPRNRINFGKIK